MYSSRPQIRLWLNLWSSNCFLLLHIQYTPCAVCNVLSWFLLCGLLFEFIAVKADKAANDVKKVSKIQIYLIVTSRKKITIITLIMDLFRFVCISYRYLILSPSVSNTEYIVENEKKRQKKVSNTAWASTFPQRKHLPWFKHGKGAHERAWAQKSTKLTSAEKKKMSD